MLTPGTVSGLNYFSLGLYSCVTLGETLTLWVHFNQIVFFTFL